MKTFEKRPDRFDAILVTEENREEIEALEGVRPVQEGAYLLPAMNGESIIANLGQWIVRIHPSHAFYSILDPFTLSTRYQEVQTHDQT